jgi:hypothetical protein
MAGLDPAIHVNPGQVYVLNLFLTKSQQYALFVRGMTRKEHPHFDRERLPLIS